jgi:hypothetical protein
LMRVLLIACAVQNTSEEYQALSKAVEKLGERWWHYLECVWCVETEKTSNEVGMALSVLFKDTRLLVTEVTGFSQGRLPDKAWEWLNEHVERRSRRPPAAGTPPKAEGSATYKTGYSP